jgi:hypothetical protein
MEAKSLLGLGMGMLETALGETMEWLLEKCREQQSWLAAGWAQTWLMCSCHTSVMELTALAENVQPLGNKKLAADVFAG